MAVVHPHLWTQVWKHRRVVIHRRVHTWGKLTWVMGSQLSTDPQEVCGGRVRSAPRSYAECSGMHVTCAVPLGDAIRRLRRSARPALPVPQRSRHPKVPGVRRDN